MSAASIYTLSLHDALPISSLLDHLPGRKLSAEERGLEIDLHHLVVLGLGRVEHRRARFHAGRSEEHTSELQSLRHLVCRLLLEKKTTAPSARSSVPKRARS